MVPTVAKLEVQPRDVGLIRIFMVDILKVFEDCHVIILNMLLTLNNVRQ